MSCVCCAICKQGSKGSLYVTLSLPLFCLIILGADAGWTAVKVEGCLFSAQLASKAAKQPAKPAAGRGRSTAQAATQKKKGARSAKPSQQGSKAAACVAAAAAAAAAGDGQPDNEQTRPAKRKAAAAGAGQQTRQEGGGSKGKKPKAG
jgi:hypothetical protein